MGSDPLRFSIVTATLNRGRFLREAIESVLAQNYPNVEHIVVDGGSTDGTLEMLKGYPHLRWVSEPDGGMYEAINKGIRMSSGELIGLLNSDDAYEPAMFSDVGSAFSSDHELAARVGGASYFKDSLGPSCLIFSIPGIEWDDEHIRWERLTGKGLVTNAWFFRRSLFDQIGFFNETYRASSDRDFLLRVGLSGQKVSCLHHQVYRYRHHSSSLTMSDTDSRNPDRAKVRIRTLSEGAAIGENLLLSQQIPTRVRPYLRRWHTNRTYALAATALFHRNWNTAYRAFRTGIQFDPFWPFAFIKFGFQRVFRSAGQV